jgi:hypothetical protein
MEHQKLWIRWRRITPQVLSCEKQITALSKVCNVNKAYALGHKNVVFSLVATTHLQP